MKMYKFENAHEIQKREKDKYMYNFCIIVWIM